MLLKYHIVLIFCLICADAIVLKSSSSEEDSGESSSSEDSGERSRDKCGKGWNKNCGRDNKGKDKGKDKNNGKWDRDWNKDNSKEKDKNKHIKFECPHPNGMFPDIYDCGRYYVCVLKKAKHKSCDRKFNFDMHRRTCMPKVVAVCDNGKGKQTTKKPATPPNLKSTTVKGHFRCPNNFGAFPHPEDCAKFYDCVFFIPTLRTCPDDRLFDDVKRQCRSAKDVRCGSRSRLTTNQPTTSRRMTPSSKTERTIRPTTVTGTSNKENTRSTRHGISTRSSMSTTMKLSTDETPNTRRPSTIRETPSDEPRTEIFSTEESTTGSEEPTPKITSEEPETVSVTSEEPTPLIISTEQPTPLIVSTEEPTSLIVSTEEPTPLIVSTEEPTPLIVSTEEPTSLIVSTEEPITTTEETTEDEPTGPPETTCSEDDLDCIITETGEVPRWFKCPHDMDSFPHPSSPKLFIFCKNKTPKVKKCGQDLIFSNEYKTCVHP